MATVCLSVHQISDFATKDTERMTGAIAKTLAANSPFMNVIQGGTFPAGVSDEIRTSVQMQAAPGDSLAIPTFVCDSDICGETGETDLTDTVEFVSRLESKRGNGPKVCVKKGYAAFRGSYVSAEDSLRKLITQYVNSDIRAQLYLRSASKFVCAAGYDFDSLFTGGDETDLGVQFANIAPTGPLSFTTLHAIARFMKESRFAEMYDGGGKGMPHFRFIGSDDAVEYLRSGVGVLANMLALTAGGYKLGEVTLSAYSFEQAPAYRGLAFGVDQRPLRANSFDVDGNLDLLDPVTKISNIAKNTAYARANPLWLEANWEVGFLMADNAFKRLVPERYVGEGSFKFAPQLHMGELDWHYVIDNGCNSRGDFGWHQYQISRAYQPMRPQWIVPILYKKPCQNLGLVTERCDTLLSYTGADTYADLECVEPEELHPT